MNNPIIIKTFKTHKGQYVYDRHTNSVISVSPEEFDELQQVERGQLDWALSDVVQKYREQGLMQENIVRKIYHPATPLLKQQTGLELSSAAQYNSFFGTLKKHHPLRISMHHGGPCVPGVLRLFVTVDEKLYPCERISDKYDYCCIGTLDTGLDFDKIEHLLNVGKITENECKDCWNLPNCMICANQLSCDNEQEPIKASKFLCCKNEKRRVMDDMTVLCTLHEFGYDILNGENTL